MFQCRECGRKFWTTNTAQKAVDKGCPKCGGTDIDLEEKGFECDPLPKYDRLGRPVDEETEELLDR
jgi:predicted  nucleic acid-binding Zn-ribbon protein